jgi:hypothetical protein
MLMLLFVPTLLLLFFTGATSCTTVGVTSDASSHGKTIAAQSNDGGVRVVSQYCFPLTQVTQNI